MRESRRPDVLRVKNDEVRDRSLPRGTGIPGERSADTLQRAGYSPGHEILLLLARKKPALFHSISFFLLENSLVFPI